MRVISDPNLQPPNWLGTDADFTVSVNESVPLGTNLLMFRAQSRAQASSVLSFLIVDVVSIFKPVTVSSTDVTKTGYVQHTKYLDYETTQSYSFTLRASVSNINKLFLLEYGGLWSELNQYPLFFSCGHFFLNLQSLFCSP
jgi:hypothetical protein